jgi:hypothetical protein
MYEAKHYCGVHMRHIKANEECSVCLCEMNKPTEKIKLGCGHYFHKACLSSCVKSECPLCRKAFCPKECLDIYKKNIINPLMLDIFSLNVNDQLTMFDSVKRLLSIVGKSGSWYLQAAYYIIQIFESESVSNTRTENVCKAISIFQTAMSIIDAKGDLNGFHVHVKDDKIFLNDTTN